MSLPNGKYIEYHGDKADCFEFMQRFAPEAVVEPGDFPVQRRPPRKRAVQTIGIKEMKDALARAQPTSDAKRVGVIVAVADKHGFTPVDIPFIRDWFRTLRLREPTAMRATVSNARKDGLIRAVAHGQFEATELGLAVIGRSDGNVVPMRRRRA